MNEAPDFNVTVEPLTVAEALYEVNRARDDFEAAGYHHTDCYVDVLEHLAEAVRRELAPLPEGEAERLAAQAEADARTMAPPVPGVTRNAGYTVQAVMPGGPAEPGSLAYWWVACEDAERGAWVTWEAYAMDGRLAGHLAYNAGHYYTGPDPAGNKSQALADLAVRAGTMTQMALRIADEITRYHGDGPYTASEKEDRRMASRLRRWAQPFTTPDQFR